MYAEHAAATCWQCKVQSLPAPEISALNLLKPSAWAHSTTFCFAGRMMDQHPLLTRAAAMLAGPSSRLLLQGTRDARMP